jgi:hypothetical protein
MKSRNSWRNSRVNPLGTVDSVIVSSTALNTEDISSPMLTVITMEITVSAGREMNTIRSGFRSGGRKIVGKAT